MPVDLDDPRLTAYALGELEDSSDINEVEAYLEAHPEGRKFVAEICDTARVLGDRLRAEAPPPASPPPTNKPSWAAWKPRSDPPRPPRVDRHEPPPSRHPSLGLGPGRKRLAGRQRFVLLLPAVVGP